MHIMKKLNIKGDTLIEVMLALAILTLLLFTAWGITNRASSISTAARLRVVMTNQLKEQAEILKSQRAALDPDDDFAAQFNSINDSVNLPSGPCQQLGPVNILNPLQHPSDSFHYTVGAGNTVQI